MHTCVSSLKMAIGFKPVNSQITSRFEHIEVFIQYWLRQAASDRQLEVTPLTRKKGWDQFGEWRKL